MGGNTDARLENGGATVSRRPKARRKLVRPLRDALAAGAVFSLISGAVVCGPSVASPHGAAAVMAAKPPAAIVTMAIAADDPAPLVQIATASSPAAADTVYKRTSSQAAWVLLALAFSVLTALNLAMARHLHRAYAPVARRIQARKPCGKGVQS